MNDVLPFKVSTGAKILLLAFVSLGVFATAYGLVRDPERTWPNLLLDGFYILSLAVVAIFFIATQRLSGARWSVSLRRIPEAFMSALPVAAILMLALYFGWQWIYPWSRPGALAHLNPAAGKTFYLRPPFVFGRMAAALLIWIVFARLFRRSSLAQDRDASLIHHRRMNRYAAMFPAIFAISFSLASFDWLLSLDPRWFSTMFAIYVFSGCFVGALAAVTLAAVALRGSSLRAFVSKDQLHDLGKMLFAFTTFWAYIWVCQYLLIWYANIPEEVSHYVTRTNGRWLPLFLLNLVVNWIVPFVVLLSRSGKRNPRVLGAISVVLLCGRWLDLYLLIMPAVQSTPRIGLLEIAIATGYAALVCLLFIRALTRAPLVPVNDPFLIDSLRLHHS